MIVVRVELHSAITGRVTELAMRYGRTLAPTANVEMK